MIGKLKGAKFMFKNGEWEFYFKKNVYLKTKRHKNGLFRPIIAISKAELKRDYGNIYSQYISNEKTLYNMVEWSQINVRSEHKDRFEELCEKLGVPKYVVFMMMLEKMEFTMQNDE